MTDEPTVFVVDDEAEELESLTAVIEAVFPRVRPYTSAAEFLTCYQSHQAGCLVLDVAMPGMSGLELQRKLNQDKIELPVVFVTGYGSVTMAVSAMRAGAVDFLEKPIRQHDLWDGVRRALEQDAQNRRRKARRRDIEASIALLSAGERDVLHWLVEGKGNRQIAEVLGISVRTIEDRRTRVMKKMGAASLAELIKMMMTR